MARTKSKRAKAVERPTTTTPNPLLIEKKGARPWGGGQDARRPADWDAVPDQPSSSGVEGRAARPA
jgi:hypothetical protein